MDNTQIKDTEVKKEVGTKAEVKLYDYAHLVVWCGKCGHKQILEENIPGDKGVQINLPPTSSAEVRLVCKECNNQMGLFYVESNKKNDTVTEDKETIKEGDSNEPVQEDSAVEVESI